MIHIDEHTKTELWSTAKALADAARLAVLPYFRSHALAVDNKLSNGAENASDANGEGFDPVTEADRSAERVMREILAKRRPQDAILGEEYGAKPGTSGLIWVLDPIDGTRAFVSGTPTWGVLIAVGDTNGPVLGIIDQPYMSERFMGGLGRAQLHGPQGETPLVTRATHDLSEAILFTTFPEVGSPDEGRAFKALSKQVKLTRYGLDCYAYGLVAAGQIDLVVEAGLQAYDIQGPMAVIEAAGGIVTTWDGGPAHQGGRIIAAANAKIHAAALEFLSGI